MGAKSRNKGSSFEREVAAELAADLGIEFRRDLEQVREQGHGDLIASDPDFPFVIECKRRATGTGCQKDWIEQAENAARSAGKLSAVVFRFDRQSARVSVPMRAIRASAPAHERAEISLAGLAYLAREIMAAGRRQNDMRALRDKIVGGEL